MAGAAVTRRGARFLLMITLVWILLAALGSPFHLRLFAWVVSTVCVIALYVNGDSE